MCKARFDCCHKGKDPKECTPERVAECHPEAKDGHPCEEVAAEAEEKSDK